MACALCSAACGEVTLAATDLQIPITGDGIVNLSRAVRNLLCMAVARSKTLVVVFALPVPRSQAPLLGTSNRLAIDSKRLILLMDEH